MRKTYVFFESSYITFMGLGYYIMLAFTCHMMCPSWTFQSRYMDVFDKESWFPLILFVTGVGSMFFAPEFLSFILVKPDKVVSVRPFRKLKTIYYEEIEDVLIDYAEFPDGRRHFAILISKQKIPTGYLHRINRFPLRAQRQMIVIPYEKERYQALLNYCPPIQREKLMKCLSTIRLYNLDKTEEQSQYQNRKNKKRKKRKKKM